VSYYCPLNYMGGKTNVIEYIKPYLVGKPLLIDIMGGGFNVGINGRNFKKIIYNDLNYIVKDLICMFKYENTKNILDKIEKLITKYSLEKHNKEVNIALELSLSDKEVIDRIVKRRTCTNKDCREIYNLEFKKPKQEGICDKCGSKLVQREDDKIETVEQRLKTYHKTSAKLVDYYKAQDLLYAVKLNIHSGKTSEDVVREVKEYLNAQ